MQSDNLIKWRLILGNKDSDGTECQLQDTDLQKDMALDALYEYQQRGYFNYYENKKGQVTQKSAGSEKSNPSVARWLGDIQNYFPKRVVDIMQEDAMSHQELKNKMMLEPEILKKAEPTVNLVANLMELGKLIPSKTKETARSVIKKVVDELLEKLESKTQQAIRGAINKSVTNFRPRFSEINWHKTIIKNLQHYQEEYKTIIPQQLYGYGRKNRRSLKDIILCIDQSGSMGESVVYSGIFGSVMASIPSVATKMVVFDTEYQDLTEDLKDPVDLLFGVQLGGGTDISNALDYCQTLVNRPDDTILVLITDLYEGGSEKKMLHILQELTKSGVMVIVLLSLNDDGAPAYDKSMAKLINAIKIPVFACTPDAFPDLMATAINKGDIHTWADHNHISLK
jgi:Mg-chelatase subunit ChlD